MSQTSAKIMFPILAAVVLGACAPAANPTSAVQPTLAAQPSAAQTATSQPSDIPLPLPFALTSSAFGPEGVVPDRYSCKGADISPELSWGDEPPGTQSLVLIFDDPSTGGGSWVHWLVYDLPPAARGLPEAVPAGEEIAGGGTHGSNSWGALEYGGPCPPQGTTHRYVFTLYALDTALDLEPGADRGELLAAMEGHTLAEAELAASFTR